MSNPEYNVHFWNHLLATAELIEAQQMESSDSANARSVVMAQLSTICEAFGDCADPVESFEEYVVVKLSQAIHSALAMAESDTEAPGSPT